MADLTVLSLCAGGGGLDHGLRLALPAARVVCWVEWEAFACAYLEAQMRAGLVDEAPLWTNIRTFDGEPWRGVVDCITAGFPCQPFSQAGRRGGADDPRHLWPEVHRIVTEVRPGLVFLENVAGHLTLGFDTVLDDLTGAGYRVTATLVRASDVGAPHQRERLFILGVDDTASARHDGTGERATAMSGSGERLLGAGRKTVADTGRGDGGGRPDGQGTKRAGQGKSRTSGSGRPVADAEGSERRGASGANNKGRRSTKTGGPSGTLADASVRGRRTRQRHDDARESDIGGSLPLFPPGPAERERWAAILDRCPELAPATESGVCILADGSTASRRHLLRLAGNAVLPLQAALALSLLLAREGLT